MPMLADAGAVAEVFEAGMLLCFGFAWPIDILRTLRTKRVVGKSVLFMSIILAGYLAGMAAKLIRAYVHGAWPELVTGLYLLNAALIGVDIALCFRYREKHGAE